MSILVFDSGIGGLTVLREVRVLMPDRRFIYVADDAAFPYGDWEEAELLKRMVGLFGQLIGQWKPEIIVIACNTASTLAIERLRETYPDQTFVGTVPAIKPAAERTSSHLVSVLATPGTVRRQYTRDLISDWAGKVEVNLVGSTGLAALAETYMRGGLVDEAAVKAEINPCFIEKDGRRTDIIVLACTHYPFLVNRMRKMAPWPVDWIDTSEAIARRAATLIEPRPTAAEKGEILEDDVAWFTGGLPDLLTAKLLRGFGLRPEPGS
jgi:glutamate racemase